MVRVTRRAALLAILVCLALAALALVWPWPGRALVRGTLGDVVAAAALAFAFAALWPRVRRRTRLGAALACAAALELAQALGFDGAVLGAGGRVALGATADPMDLVAYAVGVAMAGMIEILVAKNGIHAPGSGGKSSLV